ncbi:MAG: sugar phosphate isomerase/epimerase, partial [Bacteroidales bacterium]|nr:sugar phosphate isomerase/epimerase [Bacteroidales bacterium]
MKKHLRSLTVTTMVAIIMVLSSCAGSSPELGIGLQLYSLRDAMKEDPVATVQKVGEMGYDFVEAAGYDNGKIYAMDPLVFKSVVEDFGMKFRGAHCGQAIPDSGSWEVLMPWWDQCIAAHKEAGAEYIVQPFMGKSAYASLEGLAAYCEYFNAVGEKCNAAGLKFGYHNHAHEFEELEGEVIYDYLLENTDPENVMFQIDLYWILQGGGVPAEYFEKYPGRFLSFHIKDAKELGESGEMDFPSLLEMADLAGAKYHV